MKKLYAQRDYELLMPHVMAHLRAMTDEELHSKAEIACELAWRDHLIETLEAQLKTYHEQRD